MRDGDDIEPHLPKRIGLATLSPTSRLSIQGTTSVDRSSDDNSSNKMMDDSPNDPGVANAWHSSDARSAHEDRPNRGA